MDVLKILLRLWAICVLWASVWALPTNQLNKSCRLTGGASACNTDINVRHIEQLEGYVQPKVDACQDFHGYACGNWQRVHGADISAMSISGARIDQSYVELFERMINNSSALEHSQPMFPKLLRYYRSCRGLGKTHLRRYLDQMRQSPSDHWLDQLAILGSYGYHEHFIKIEVSQHNISNHMLVIQRHNYNLRLNLTVKTFNALQRHLQITLPPLSHLSDQFRRLEEKLEQLTRPQSNSSDDETLRTFTLDQLQREIPQVNWTHVLQQQMGIIYDGSHELMVDEIPLLRQIIHQLNKESPVFLRLYSLARFLQHLLQLPHNPLNSHNKTSVECVQHMRKTLYLPMNYAYERTHYSAQRAADEHVIFGVFEELKAQFSQQLRRNEFALDAKLLVELQSKVDGVRLNVGNMPRNASHEFYVNCSRHWRVHGDFYENHLLSLQHYYSHLAEMEQTQDETMRQLFYSFNHHAPELLDNIDATPYFYCLGSIIIMPYAYVQLPFYHAQFWPALLYGDLANTLGHEMLHAFDPYFIDYDAKGMMRDYSDQLRLNSGYMARVDCLNDTEVVMLNERAADISGTRLALQTYMQQPAERRHNGHLYFLQFAQFFCGEEADLFHDKGSKRLNYVLAQMPEFAEVFQCAPGTPMNPTKRCSFW